MTRRERATRFVEYIESLAQVLGYVDRAGPLKDYCTGLLMPGQYKSVGRSRPVVAPVRVSAELESLLHVVGESAWSDESLLAKVRANSSCRRWRRRAGSSLGLKMEATRAS